MPTVRHFCSLACSCQTRNIAVPASRPRRRSRNQPGLSLAVTVQHRRARRFWHSPQPIAPLIISFNYPPFAIESGQSVFKAGLRKPCGELPASKSDARHPAPDARRGCRWQCRFTFRKQQCVNIPVVLSGWQVTGSSVFHLASEAPYHQCGHAFPWFSFASFTFTRALNASLSDQL